MTWLCVPCCYSLGINPFEKAKKTAKKVGAKDDRAKIVHYEERKGVTGLSDICIQASCIHKPRLMPDHREIHRRCREIGRHWYHKSGQGLQDHLQEQKAVSASQCEWSRQTARPKPLPSFTPVIGSTWQCTTAPVSSLNGPSHLSGLVHESYVTMANLCPNIERLHLQLCGQLMADTLVHWGKTLTQLRRVELYAPFLVRKDGWESFITACGKRLEGFLVTQSPRIDRETIACLVKSCPNLTELRLAEIGLLDGECLLSIAKLKKLKLLDLSAPPHSLQDDEVVALLAAVGSTLESINLSGNPELTDAVLLAIAQYCPKLQELHMRHQVEFTNEGVAQFFTELSSRGYPGFVVIDLEKGHDLQDEALGALLAHSGNSVEWLSILGWRDTTADALGRLAQCGALRQLDIGWCRKVTDFALKDILDGCRSVQTVRVWGKSGCSCRSLHSGCNQLTDRIPRKRGVKVGLAGVALLILCRLSGSNLIVYKL